MPVAMEKGTRLDYRLRLWGVRFRWQTLISSWEPPHRFVDEQLAGPYAQWVHTHRFEADGDGTLVEDDVDYALPLAPLGELALPIVRRQLERIFSYRRETIARLLG